jgi:hypothetical protein
MAEVTFEFKASRNPVLATGKGGFSPKTAMKSSRFHGGFHSHGGYPFKIAGCLFHGKSDQDFDEWMGVPPWIGNLQMVVEGWSDQVAL